MPKPKRIFVSHSTKDRDFVEREIIPLLESHGIDTWYSTDDIRTGTQWDEQIARGLESCDWFLVVLSPRSLESRWVKMEFRWAVEERPDEIVPVIIETCEWKGFHIWLRSYQCADFSLDSQDARQALLKTWDIEFSIQQETRDITTTSPSPPTSQQSQRPAPAKPKQTRQRESQQTDRIEVQCPNGHRHSVSQSSRGERVKCPTCSTHFVIPKNGAETSRTASVESVPVFDSQELITNSIGMKLQLIPAGEFLMGSVDSDETACFGEKPQHLVRITKPFYLGIFLVTQEEYERVLGENPSSNQNHICQPVESVSWFDVVAFCNRLSEQESIQPDYKINGKTVSVVGGSGYRLPTEAEWEYACRARTTTPYSFGNDASQLGQHAWYDKNNWDIGEQYPHRVGQKLPNPWGLYDMYGNVWEWCQDWYAPYGSEKALTDPMGPKQGEYRVLRGGAFFVEPLVVRSAFRSNDLPDDRDNNVGFRLARTYP